MDPYSQYMLEQQRSVSQMFGRSQARAYEQLRQVVQAQGKAEKDETQSMLLLLEDDV